MVGSAKNLLLLNSRVDPNVKSLLSAMTVKPSGSRIALINSTIKNLKAQGLWSKLGLFYMLAAHNAQAAGLNWVSPSTAVLTPTNSPTFAADKGYTGDGSTKYLETGVLHNAIPNFAMNAAHAATWNLTASNNFTVGLSSTVNLAIASVVTRAVRINGTTPLTTTADPTTGHVVGVRRDSANLFSYRNGGTEVSGANTSSALTANTVRLLVGNSLFFGGQLACAHVGDQLSAAQVAALYAILQNYLHQVGAV